MRRPNPHATKTTRPHAPPCAHAGATVNYTILQSLRDAIIVTSCGAEALPFINGFCVLPMSLAFFFYYDKLVGVELMVGGGVDGWGWGGGGVGWRVWDALGS